MSILKRFLYGILIGITSIAPGISGGTIAIALGFYEKLIYAIAHLLKEFKNNFSFLLPFGIGAMVSIATLSVSLEYLFNNFPLPTSGLFIGLILGTLPLIKEKLLEKLNGKKAKPGHILTGVIFFAIVLIPLLFSAGKTAGSLSWEAQNGTSSVLLFLFTGLIIAATLIVPGLSGTMILMSLGLYKGLLHTASSFVTAAVTLNMTAIINLLHAVIPIGIGLFAGGFLIAKVLHRLFTRIPAYIYSAIFALICATPIVMLAEINTTEFSSPNIIISIITFIIGLLLTKKIGDHK